VIHIVKKKEAEPSDPHVREAYLAEGRERYTTPTPTVISPTPIPAQPIVPIPVPTPSPIEQPPSPKKELLIIDGINEKIASQLEKLGINNIDDLAKASAENIAKDLKVDLSTVQKWISKSKKLQ
jgi:predicted flap endonuclease-1-like 5' DNA nuclease